MKFHVFSKEIQIVATRALFTLGKDNHVKEIISKYEGMCAECSVQCTVCHVLGYVYDWFYLKKNVSWFFLIFEHVHV